MSDAPAPRMVLLLVVLGFVLVTAVKAYEGRLYGGRPARVTTR